MLLTTNFIVNNILWENLSLHLHSFSNRFKPASRKVKMSFWM